MNTVTVIINVRYTCGTHVARARGFHGITASCSCDPQIHAVRLCALKCQAWPSKRVVNRMNFEASGIRLKQTTSETYLAEWEAEPLAPSAPLRGNTPEAQ